MGYRGGRTQASGVFGEASYTHCGSEGTWACGPATGAPRYTGAGEAGGTEQQWGECGAGPMAPTDAALTKEQPNGSRELKN